MGNKKKQHIIFDRTTDSSTNFNKKEIANFNDKHYVAPQAKRNTFLKLDRKGRG